MNLKVPRAILPLGCAILSTRAKTVRGVGTTPPLGELGLTFSNFLNIKQKKKKKKKPFHLGPVAKFQCTARSGGRGWPSA